MTGRDTFLNLTENGPRLEKGQSTLELFETSSSYDTPPVSVRRLSTSRCLPRHLPFIFDTFLLQFQKARSISRSTSNRSVQSLIHQSLRLHT